MAPSQVLREQCVGRLGRAVITVTASCGSSRISQCSHQSMRALLLPIIGLVLGTAVGGTIANVAIPSHGQLRHFAADLEPSGSTTTDVSELSGRQMRIHAIELGGPTSAPNQPRPET